MQVVLLLTPKRSLPDLGVAVLLLVVATTTLPCLGLNLVASTSDLAAIADEIAGERITTVVLCRPDQDPHSFEILPRHVVAVQRADLFLQVGAGLDYWSEELIRAANNANLIVSDCSDGIALIHDEGAEEHDHGAHEAGNPHYWLGPSNVRFIAQNIAQALQIADSAHSLDYSQACEAFISKFDNAYAGWLSSMKMCAGQAIVTYHRSWDYFARDFGLVVIGTIEAHPGAEPSAANVAALEQSIHQARAKLLIMDPYESDRLARVVAEDTGISITKLPSSVERQTASQDVFSFFDFLTRQVRANCTASQR